MNVMKRGLFMAMLLLPTLAWCHPPWGIAIDSEGSIYIPDIMHYGRGCLLKLTPEGHLKVLAKDFHAHNVNLDKKGNPVSAHGEDTHTMIRFLSNGLRDTLVHTTNLDNFFGGNACYSPLGNVFFQNQHQVWQVLPSGKKALFNDHVAVWSQAIYADHKERLYVPDIGEGKGKLYRLTRNGSSELLADNLITRGDQPYDRHNDVLLGMYVDTSDQVFICETAGQRVISIDDQKQVSTYYRETSGWTPCGITFHKGVPYILEFDLRKAMKGPRIIKLDASGSSEVVFDYDTYKPPVKKQEHSLPVTPVEPTNRTPNWMWAVIGLAFLALILGVRRFLNKLAK